MSLSWRYTVTRPRAVQRPAVGAGLHLERPAQAPAVLPFHDSTGGGSPPDCCRWGPHEHRHRPGPTGTARRGRPTDGQRAERCQAAVDPERGRGAPVAGTGGCSTGSTVRGRLRAAGTRPAEACFRSRTRPVSGARPANEHALGSVLPGPPADRRGGRDRRWWTRRPPPSRRNSPAITMSSWLPLEDLVVGNGNVALTAAGPSHPPPRPQLRSAGRGGSVFRSRLSCPATTKRRPGCGHSLLIGTCPSSARAMASTSSFG